MLHSRLVTLIRACRVTAQGAGCDPFSAGMAGCWSGRPVAVRILGPKPQALNHKHYNLKPRDRRVSCSENFRVFMFLEVRGRDFSRIRHFKCSG